MRPLLIICMLLTVIGCNSSQIKERILYSSSPNGNSDIFFMNSDGSEKIPLIQTEFEEWGATFMDNDNISFLRQIKDSVFRYRYNLKLQKEYPLAQMGLCYLNDKNAVYNQNGDFVFSCGLGLFLKRKEESIFRAISIDNKNKINYLSWSFDGKKVLFTDNQTGSNDVYMVDVNTMKVDNLTHSEFNDERGDLSPDGKFLVFSSNRHDKADQDLFVLNLETRELENITNAKGYQLIGRWSRDGQYIYYGGNQDGNWEIYRYQLKNKTTERLTYDPNFDGDPRVR